MAAFTAYDVVGKKEDVSDVISNISPTKTPFTTLTGSDTVDNTLFQWQEDSLANPNTANAQIQGFQATDATLVPTVMRSNYTQIMQKTINVAATTDAVKRYGRAKETAYQVAKAGQELKRDREAIMLGGQAAAAGSTAVAATMASFQAQVDVSKLFKTGAVGTAMTEALFVSALQALYIAGVDPDIVMVPPTEAMVIPGYASAAGRYRELTGSDRKTLVNVIDLYVSPFGEVKVLLNRFQLATDYLIFDPAMWQKKVLSGRDWFRETLAKTGDNTRMMIVGEFSLAHKNWNASAIVRKSA